MRRDLHFFASGFKALVVDLDGTLIDTEPIHVRSYEIILSALTATNVVVEQSDIIGHQEPEIWRHCVALYGLSADAARLQDVRRYVLLGLYAETARHPEPTRCAISLQGFPARAYC
jgi:beta-phosphoglucomutase-like phosphatase (HAD superfamily)